MLRRKARPVRKINAAIRRLLDEMAETMYAAPGVGLAANQVGFLKRVIVADCGKPHGLLKLINPEIVYAEGSEVATEACLSIPGYVGDVERSYKIKVAALNPEGHRVWVEAEGFWARCLQHEIDHLDGILYTDKATNVREAQAKEAGAEDGEEVGASVPEGYGEGRAMAAGEEG